MGGLSHPPLDLGPPLLLLVVDRDGGDHLSTRIGSLGGDGASFAVGGEDDATGYKNLRALLDGERQRVIIDFRDGARVGSGIAGCPRFRCSVPGSWVTL